MQSDIDKGIFRPLIYTLDAHLTLGVSQSETRSQELHLGLSRGQQEPPSIWAIILYLPGTLAGSWIGSEE